jgi:hypothetical protein
LTIKLMQGHIGISLVFYLEKLSTANSLRIFLNHLLFKKGLAVHI